MFKLWFNVRNKHLVKAVHGKIWADKALGSINYAINNHSRTEGWTQHFSTSNPKFQIIKSLLPDVPSFNLTLDEFMLKNINKYGDLIALECSLTGRKYRYSEIKDRSKAFAASLLNDIGISSGDVILHVLPNIPEYHIITIGCSMAGCISSLCNPIYTADEIKRQYMSSGAKYIITTETIYPVVEQAIKLLAKDVPVMIVNISGENHKVPAGKFDVLKMMDPSINTTILNSLKKRSPDDIVFLPYSSGTTGLPKGVQLTHRNIVSALEIFDNCGQSQYVNIEARSQAVVPGILPFFHIYGIITVMLDKFVGGHKIVTLPKFTIENFIQMLKQHKPDLLYIVPPIILLLNNHPAITPEDLKCLKVVISGAAPIGKSDFERLQEKSGPQLEIRQGYGLTETSGVVALQHDYYQIWDRQSIGGLVPNTEVQIVDSESGKSLGPNQTGELWVRSPLVMKGYHNNLEATQNSLTADGWFKTGDMFYYDDKGQFFITDRLKELIKVKGFQVAPAELEELLRTHPSIRDAAVIGVPHPINGEGPKAFVVKAPGKSLTEIDVENFVAEKAAPFKKLTGGVHFVEAIPRSTAGKILKVELKKQFCN